MKKTWIDPRIEVQQFVPDEYVAACWGVACDVDKANEVEESFYTWPNTPAVLQITHNSANCGQQTNQWVRDTNNDGAIDSMIETGTDGLGDLVCTLYTDDTYTQTASYSSVSSGDYIYWTTSSGSKTWHHQGQVVSDSTNRS